MSFRRAWVIGAALGLFMAGPATGQVQSSALTDATPWTYNFLPKGEPKLPATSWTAADPETILDLLGETRTGNLSPVEQMLLRRLVLSGANKPKSELASALLAERARIMVEIGEARAAARLLPELTNPPEGLTPEELSLDLRMALGENDAVCTQGLDAAGSGTFWARLRAICYTLMEEPSKAELAVEIAAAEGVSDPWLTRAVFYALEEIGEAPEARLDNGLNLALSIKAQLKPSDSAISTSRKDIAAAIARSDSFSPALRAQVAGIASEAGLVSPAIHRDIYALLIAEGDFKPRTPLEVAVVTSAQSPEDIGARARTLRAALRTALGNPARFGAVARLLQADIETLPRSQDTARMAQMFAQASIASGNMEEAAKWVAPLAPEPAEPSLAEEAPDDEAATDSDESEAAVDETTDVPPPEEPLDFATAWIKAVILMVDAEAAPADQTVAVSNLLAGMDTDQRIAASARLLTLWSALGTALPADARQFLSNVEDKTPALSPYKRRALIAAAEAGAGSEVALKALAMISGDAYKLHPADAAMLVETLRQIGQPDIANQLALEATGYWQAGL